MTDEALPDTLDPEALVEHLLDWGYTFEQLETVLIRVGRQNGPHVLSELLSAGGLGPREVARAVPVAWCTAEHPLALLDRETWRALFSVARYTHNGRRRARPRLPRQLSVGSDESHRRGWSWTDDRRAAEWFASRPVHPTPGVVWTAVVAPERLLVRMTNVRGDESGRSESEYVVDTDGLATGPA